MGTITHEEFLKNYLGTFVETRNSDPDARNQCVDLALKYAVDVWGIPLTFSALPRGNAISWSHGTHIQAQYGKWVRNLPTNVPPQGSIIVFNISKYGHIAIVDNADENDVTVIEQNAGGHAATYGIYTNKNKKSVNQRATDCVRKSTYVHYRHVLGWYEQIKSDTFPGRFLVC